MRTLPRLVALAQQARQSKNSREAHLDVWQCHITLDIGVSGWRGCVVAMHEMTGGREEGCGAPAASRAAMGTATERQGRLFLPCISEAHQAR
jgi:hypothetical protein